MASRQIRDGVAVVALDEVGGELANALGHVAGEAVERRRRPERRVELVGVHRRDPLRVEPADPAAELERTGEGLLQRDLLVEGEADQERQRVARRGGGRRRRCR